MPCAGARKTLRQAADLSWPLSAISLSLTLYQDDIDYETSDRLHLPCHVHLACHVYLAEPTTYLTDTQSILGP